jgi:hypothetical protein
MREGADWTAEFNGSLFDYSSVSKESTLVCVRGGGGEGNKVR